MDNEKVKVRFNGKYATALSMPGFHGVVCPDDEIDMFKYIYDTEYSDKNSIFELVKESKKKKMEKNQEDEEQ